MNLRLSPVELYQMPFGQSASLFTTDQLFLGSLSGCIFHLTAGIVKVYGEDTEVLTLAVHGTRLLVATKEVSDIGVESYRLTGFDFIGGKLVPLWSNALNSMPYRMRYVTQLNQWWIALSDRTVCSVDCETGEISLLIRSVSSPAMAFDVASEGTMAVIGCQEGGIELYEWIDSSWKSSQLYRDDGPISQVMFNSSGDLLVTRAIGDYCVLYQNVQEYGLSDCTHLLNPGGDTVSSCLFLQEYDADSQIIRENILFGTFCGEIVVYEQTMDGEYVLGRHISFAEPVLGLDKLDYTADGLEEVVVYTSRGVLIMHTDMENVFRYLEAMLSKEN